MQMQLKMKELELGQYMRLYKEREETVSLVLLSVQNKFHFAKHIRFVLPFYTPVFKTERIMVYQ